MIGKQDVNQIPVLYKIKKVFPILRNFCFFFCFLEDRSFDKFALRSQFRGECSKWCCAIRVRYELCNVANIVMLGKYCLPDVVFEHLKAKRASISGGGGGHCALEHEGKSRSEGTSQDY
jgi:hypothetical protein